MKEILIMKISHIRIEIFFIIIIFFLVFLTGYVSDDYSEISNIKNIDNSIQYLPFNTYINIPVLYYTHYLFYYFVSIENYILISLVKFFYVSLSFFLISKFFSLFTNYFFACLISFLFIFWPTHDSTVYFFLAQYLMLTIAFQLYAYYLIERNFLKKSLLFSFMGSFISYGSTPIAAGLFFLFLFNRSYKKSLFIIIPNIIYIFYYIFISKIVSISSISRIPDNFEIFNFFKNYLFQIISLIDVNIGISFIIKIYYSILENNFFSILVSMIFFILICLIKKNNLKNKLNIDALSLDAKLLSSFVIIILMALFMFSLTGGYYHNSFNLGNRTSIYSALFFAYLFVYFFQKKYFFFISLFILAIFGISNHWKEVQVDQGVVINNLKSNQNLKDYNNKKILFVVGSEYSKFGKFSHVEFFSASHVAESVFNINNLGHLKIKTLNRSFNFDGEYLNDKKFLNRRFLVDKNIYVYNTNSNQLSLIDKNIIQDYISGLQKHNRHWIQLVEINIVRKMISKYFPNLNYLFY